MDNSTSTRSADFVPSHEHKWTRKRWKNLSTPWLQTQRLRACRVCGTLHPDDAVGLVASGWSVEGDTGMDRRVFLYPPGALEGINSFLESLVLATTDLDPDEQVPGHLPMPQASMPSPPAYARLATFSPEENERMLDALAYQKRIRHE